MVCAQREIDRPKKAIDRLSKSNSTLRLQNKDWHAKLDAVEATAKEHDASLSIRAQAFDLLEAQNKDQEKEVKRLTVREKALVEELMQVGHTAKDLLAYNRLQENWSGEQPTAHELVVLLGREAAKLRQAAQAIFTFLWPDAPVSETMAQLTTKVAEVPAIVDRLRDLAARAGAEMALALMLSWYKDARVEKIDGGFRAGIDLITIRQAHPKLRASAIKIADYADIDEVLTDSEFAGIPDAEASSQPVGRDVGAGSANAPPPPPETASGQYHPHGKGPAA